MEKQRNQIELENIKSLNNMMEIEFVGNYVQSDIGNNYLNEQCLSHDPLENKKMIVESVVQILRRKQQQEIDEDDKQQKMLIGLEIGKPVNWIVNGEKVINMQQNDQKCLNIDIPVNSKIEQKMQFIGLEGYNSVYQITMTQDIIKMNLDSVYLDLDLNSDNLYQNEQQLKPRSRVTSTYDKKRRQSAYEILPKRTAALKQRSETKYISKNDKYVSVKPQGVFSVQWMKLMDHPQNTEYFLTDKMFFRGVQGQKVKAEKVIKQWMQQIKSKMAKQHQKIAYFSVQYIYQLQALYFYYRIGDHYKNYYTQYESVNQKNMNIGTSRIVRQKSYNKFEINPVSIDGFEGSFSKFSFGEQFAIYEMEISDKPQIKFIDTFINKRASLTDSLGQYAFEYEVKKDILRNKILQGYYLAIQRMIETKQDKCFLAINDGNYCTYSEIDSQFFRVNQVHSSKHLEKEILKDQDQLDLPFTNYESISYKSNKQEQYIYELNLENVSQDFINEVEVQLKKLVRCKQNGQYDGPWDEYNEEQKSMLHYYRFEIGLDKIHYQGSSDAVIFLQENDLDGFKKAIQNQNIKSNNILFQEGKSLLRQCMLNNRPEFSIVCLEKLAEREWKFKLTYDDLLMLIIDKKLDDSLKASVLNSIFLPSRVALNPAQFEYSSPDNKDSIKCRFNGDDANNQIELPITYGIMNLTFRTFQNILFGTRNSTMFSNLSKYIYEQKLIRYPVHEIRQQEVYQNTIIWLSDRDKMTYCKKGIDKVPNIYDNGYSNYSQMREIINLKQLETQIDYYTCSFKMHERPFHDESIKFLKTLGDVEQVQLFDTDIQHIIDYRWKQSYFFIVINSIFQILLGLVMTVSLCLTRAGNIDTASKFNLVAFVIAVILVIRDLIIICYSFYVKQVEINEYQKIQFGQIYHIYNIMIQIIKFPFYAIGSYLGDLDEILDMLSQIAYIVYYIMNLQPNKSQNQQDFLNIFHLITITASLMRGLFILFRLFGRVRYMVFMIKQVITDMIPFTIIFISVMMMFGVIFVKLSEIDPGYQKNDSANQYINTSNILYGFKGSIDILLLGNDQNQETMTGWTMNLMGFVFIQIIMLNLIIAVISDTYTNIQSVKQSSAMKSQIRLMVDSLEILNAVYNILKPIFKFTDNKVYINFCKYAKRSVEKDENDYYQQMLALKNQIKDMERKLENQVKAASQSTVKKIQKMISDNGGIINRHDRLQTSIDHNINERADTVKEEEEQEMIRVQNMEILKSNIYNRTATKEINNR